jgi:3-hydroxyacyl-CoA dehydrogenase
MSVDSSTEAQEALSIRTVLVAGGGILGSQIAFQIAFRGLDVTLYDIDDAAIARARQSCVGLKQSYAADLNAQHSAVEAALDRILFTHDLGEAARSADLVIEAIPENLDIKKAFYAQLAGVAPESTIFASNSSTFVPSLLAGFTGRQDRYLHLHFSNQIWKHNTAEIMGGPSTRPDVFDAVVVFAGRIGMVPLPLHREHAGYIGNALLMPLLSAALDLVAHDIADVHSIDRNWMINRETPLGPFAMLDNIGMRTAHLIASHRHQKEPSARTARVVEYLADMIQSGKLGTASGRGFYTYPDPDYARSDFLS